ncbi:nibrin [Trichonephila clavipes]|nr:nibrin [Trichonephila clavipes]
MARSGRNYSWFQNRPVCSECNADKPHLSGCHSGTTSTFASGRHECCISVYGRQLPSSPRRHCRRMPSIGGYDLYELASILTGLENNRACVGYAWPTNCSPSISSHLSTGSSEDIA